MSLTASGAGSIMSAATYTGDGLTASRSLANAVTRGIEWDPTYRTPTRLLATRTGTTGALQDDTYLRDGVGRVTSIVDDVADVRQCYSYEEFNRLSAAWTQSGAAGSASCSTSAPSDSSWDIGTSAYENTWTYSPAGSIATRVQAAHSVASTTETYTYADTSSPAAVTKTTSTAAGAYAYDSAGRMIARPGQTLTWDVLSNLTTLVAGSATTTYLYDDAGQRYAEITPAKVTVYQGAWEATDPSPGATGTTDVTVTRYYTAGGTQLASKTTGGTLLVMVGDVQGSARVTVDSSGTTTTNTYTPYGTTRAGSSVTSAHGWLNQIADPTGLTYLNARYYDPMLGRFLSPDPLMNVGDPRTLDPYRYADNNPAMFTDPTGLAACGPYNASTASCWESFIGVTTSNGVGEASSGDSSGSGNGSGSGSGGSGKGNGSSGPCLNKVRCGSGDGHWPDLPRFSHIPLPIPGGCTEFGTAADLRGVNYCYMRYGQQTQSAWTVDALEEEAKEGAVPFNEFAHDFVVEGIPFFAKHHGDEVLQVAGATALVICVVVTGGGCAVAGFIIAGATVWDGNHYRNWDGKRTTAYIIFSAATLGTGGAAAEGASGLGARIGVGLGVDFPAFIGGWGIESGEP